MCGGAATTLGMGVPQAASAKANAAINKRRFMALVLCDRPDYAATSDDRLDSV